ncbi:hypothetical protein [Kordia zhangzhouensis]|nr:hypothetical protein [Kordia zhangzhouensis]
MKSSKTTIEIGNEFKEVEIYYDEAKNSQLTIAIHKNQVTVFQEGND